MGDVETLKKQVRELSKKLASFENNFKYSQKELIKQALEEFTNQNKKNSLKSEFDRKFRQSKKDIIKQKILETAKTKPHPLADLKYFIVNQLNYCSKASFYRYIEEMKDVIEIKGNIVTVVEKVTV